MSKRIHYLAAAATGLLLAGAFPPLDQGLVAWVALVPLFWALRETPPLPAFRLGFLAGVVWFGLTLSWIAVFGVAAWVALVAVEALFVGGFAVVFCWLRDRYTGWDILLAPVLWAATEIARSTGTLAFPWALLGVSQHRFLPILQLASVGGVYLLSAAVVLANAALVAVLPLSRSTRRALVGSVAAAMVFLAAVGFGVWRLQQVPSPTVRVAALQPNVPPLQKGSSQTFTAQIRLMERLTREARGQGADLIVFPESAIPLNLFGKGGLVGEVGSWAPDRVVVASSLEVGTDDRFRNIAAALYGGRILGVYTKRRLVPFGEAGITAGEEEGFIPTPLGPIGIAISYESAFPGIARVAAQRGADFLLVMTNDGWFGGTAGAAQHAADAPVRAVETGRTLIRAADTGISLVVTPYGHVQGRVLLDTVGLTVQQAYAPLQTIYVRGGWLIPPAFVAVTVLLILGAAPDALRPWLQDPAFRRLLSALGLPAMLFVLRPFLVRLIPQADVLFPLALFALVLLSGGWKYLKFHPGRVAASAALGSAVVGVLVVTMIKAYDAYGIAWPALPPVREWLPALPVAWMSALAVEAWLRGVVFSLAQAWKGTAAALIVSTLPAVLITPDASPEVFLFSLFTSAVFGFIRVLTGDALGLSAGRTLEYFLLQALP
ncbi:MAG: apolipoprotein N-acyltransferase [bacterium]